MGQFDAILKSPDLGLPPKPGEPQSPDAVWEDTRLPATTANQQRSNTVTALATPPSPPAAAQFVPATGWVFNDRGEVTLTALAPNATPYSIGSNRVPCRASGK